MSVNYAVKKVYEIIWMCGDLRMWWWRFGRCINGVRIKGPFIKSWLVTLFMVSIKKKKKHKRI